MIVQDEERRLPQALASVAFCDEIVVIDGGSSDATVAIAQAAGAKVIENKWPGFARQRNLALDAASCEWVLEIDADERVSPQLAHSIRAFVADPPRGAEVGAFAIRNRFLGGPLGPSAKYPQYRFRIFRRERHRHDERLSVHEGLPAAGATVLLEGDLEHELADSLGEAVGDVWRYARLQSRHVPRPRSPAAYALGVAVRPPAKLLYRLLLEGGWRDGWRGALKIWLDCASDALVWVLVALRGAPVKDAGGEQPAAGTQDLDASGYEGGGRETTGNGHFAGAWATRERPVKVVAVACGPERARRAAAWLAAIGAQGAEVALVTDQPGAQLQGVRLRHISHLGPLALLRAMEAERQLLAPDALVGVGGARVRAIARLMPRRLRGAVDGLDPAQPGEQALARLRDAARA